MADTPRVLPAIYAVDTSVNYQIGGFSGDEFTYQYTRKFTEMFTGDAAFDTSIMLASNLDCDLFTFMLNSHYEFRMLIKDSESSDANYRKMVADAAFEGYEPCKLLGSVLIRSDDQWSSWNVYNLTTNTALVGGSLANARFCLGNKVHGFNKLLLAATTMQVEKNPPVQTTGGNNRYIVNSYESITTLENIEDRVMNYCGFDIKHVEKREASTVAYTFNGEQRPMLAYVVEYNGDILFFNASTITTRSTGGLTTQYQTGLPQIYTLGRMVDTPNWVQMSTDVSKPQWVTRPEKGVTNDAGMVCEIYTSSSRWYVYGKHVYNGALVRRLLTMSGLYFTWDIKWMNSSSDLAGYNADLCLGTRDQYGLIKQDGYLKGFDEIKEKDPYSDLDYSKIPIVNNNPPAPDAPEADNFPSLGLDTMGATGLANGVSWFVMSDSDMGTLAKLGVYYSEGGVEAPWETISKANAVAETSKDAIISIIQFPYDVSKMHSAEGRHGNIQVYIPGVFNSDSEWFGADYCGTGAYGGYITDLNRIVNAGSVLIPPRRGGEVTFLDFEPYTSLQMYVPFAGWVSLPCSQCMNNTVALQYVIDPPTGSGRAYISVSGCVIKDIPFTIGTPVPTSVHQTGPLMSTLMNTAFSVAGTVAGAAMAAESGGLTMSVGTSMAIGAVSNLSNTLMDSCVPKTQTVGTNGTAVTSFPTPKQPVILINRPRVKVPDNMGHRYGYACDKEDVLSNLSGMTVCANVDTSGINATAGEKARLKAILESGFYA